jgi:tetratricopeptide (TPR) repeat protein
VRLFLDGKFASLFAERHLYLPAIGIALVLARGLQALQARVGTGAIVALGTVGCLILGVATRARNTDWQSNEALWLAEVKATPNNGEAWMQLTTHYLRKEKPAVVAELCAKNLAGHTNAQFHNNCAVAAQRTGRVADAERLFLRAIALGGGVTVYANLARLYVRQGRLDEAQGYYVKATDLETNVAMKHVRRGEMILRLYPERKEEARAEFQAALTIDPNFQAAQAWMVQVPR